MTHVCLNDLLLTSFVAGLFAPRQGQAYREEQRRRRSQFDRGTPGAELELQQGFVVPGRVPNIQMSPDVSHFSGLLPYPLCRPLQYNL